MNRYYGHAEKILRLPSCDRFENVTLRRQMSPQEKALFDDADLQANTSMWAKQPLRFGVAYRSRLKRSRNISVYLKANVTEILLNAAGNCAEVLRAATLYGIRRGKFSLSEFWGRQSDVGDRGPRDSISGALAKLDGLFVKPLASVHVTLEGADAF